MGGEANLNLDVAKDNFTFLPNSTSEDADQSELNGNTTLMEEGETNNVINGSSSGVNETTQTEFDRISTGVESDSNSTTFRKPVYSKSPTILKSNNIQNSSEDNESGFPLVTNPTLCILIASC